MEVEQLKGGLDSLESRLRAHIQMGHDLFTIYAGDIYVPDLYVTAVLNRSAALIRGFSALVPDNYYCAAHLIRLQIDNLLRFFAATLVADPTDFVMQVMRGTRIDRIKDQDGRVMTDAYLAEKADARWKGIKGNYEFGCEYVHLSGIHVAHAVQPSGHMEAQLSIGAAEPGITLDTRLNAIQTMISTTGSILFVAQDYLCRKAKAPKAALGGE